MQEFRTRTILLDQFDIAWALTWYHLEDLTTDECLWEPASSCIHVRQTINKGWRPDWPEKESYEIGPPSIAWTTWHICYWWTKAVTHLEGGGSIEADDVSWPGDAHSVRLTVQALHNRWRSLLASYDEAAFQKRRENSWPIPDSSPDSIAAWLNLELMKNAAEIGAIRFLYAASPRL